MVLPIGLAAATSTHLIEYVHVPVIRWGGSCVLPSKDRGINPSKIALWTRKSHLSY